MMKNKIELLKEDYSKKKEEFSLWWCHLSNHNESSLAYRYSIYEHALQKLPGSYKLWYSYIKKMRESVLNLEIQHPAIKTMNNLYERALAHLPSMPKIWVEYLHFLIDQGLITKTRRFFDRALQVLPITQHELIWPLYLKFICQSGIPPNTALRVYVRYLKLMPSQAEDYVAYLKSVGHWEKAARQISEIVKTTNFRSIKDKTNYQLWLEMCDIITKHPEEIKQLQVEELIRLGICKFTNEVGRLWITIADYYIRKGMFERSRDIYEEGMISVTTVRDCSLIFDAYTQFEESFLFAKMNAKKNVDKINEVKLDIDDINLRLARLEFLLERRPELVSSVVLKQNPHSVFEWHKRIQIFDGHILKQIEIYFE
jgi:pre-mRNA-splicing factor SYF1